MFEFIGSSYDAAMCDPESRVFTNITPVEEQEPYEDEEGDDDDE